MNYHTMPSIRFDFGYFSHGVRVVMLIDRGVMNSNKGSKRWINKIITTNQAEWENAVQVLMEMQEHLNDPDIRLYSCVNDRKLDKSIDLFKHRQIDLDSTLNHEKFYKKINDSFCSCLMAPENRKSKYFLMDIDTKDLTATNYFVENNSIKIIARYETKKGHHFIVEPFNVKLAEDSKDFTIKKDGLLLINWLRDKE